MATFVQVKTALVNRLKTITTGNGYATDLIAGSFKTIQQIDYQDENDYPRVLVFLDTGETGLLPAGRYTKKVDFLVVFFEIERPGVSSVEDAVEAFIADVETAIDSDFKLNGTVDMAKLSTFTTDSGNAYPEGVAVLKIETERQTTS